MLCLETHTPGVTEPELSLCSYNNEMVKWHPWGQAVLTSPTTPLTPQRADAENSVGRKTTLYGQN